MFNIPYVWVSTSSEVYGLVLCQLMCISAWQMKKKKGLCFQEVLLNTLAQFLN